MVDRIFGGLFLGLLIAAAISWNTYERWIACNAVIEVADQMSNGVHDGVTLAAYQTARADCAK